MISSSTILSVFEITDKVSETSRTAVYRGRHLSSAQDAAIKLIKVSGLRGAKERRQAFEERARSLLEIKHGALPRALDVGRTDEGDLFIGFEWVEGRRLADLGEIDERLRIEHLQNALGGLRALADRGLALLNLRPSNLFVRADGSTMLTGVGTAFANPEGRHESRGKRPDDRYRAPEIRSLQALDNPDLWRADVYSLAMTAAELFGAQVRGAGGPVPYVKLPADLERRVPSSADLGMLLERALHQKPDRRPELSPVLETLQLCVYDLESQSPEAGNSELPAGSETVCMEASGAEEMGFEVEIEDEDRTPKPAIAEPAGEQLAAAASAKTNGEKAAPMPAAEASVDSSTSTEAEDGNDDSIVGSLRKMWSEGLADVDLKASAGALDPDAETGNDLVVADEGTVISAEQSGQLDLRDQPFEPVESPDEILDIDELPTIEPLAEGVRPATRQPTGGVARVADEVAALLSEERGSKAATDDSERVEDTTQLEVAPVIAKLAEAAAQPNVAAELDSVPAAEDRAGHDQLPLPVTEPVSQVEPFDSEDSEVSARESASEIDEIVARLDERATPATAPALREPALSARGEPALSDVGAALVEAPAVQAPANDLYRVPFFIAAAAAGLLLIAFLWSLFRPPPSFDPDLSRTIDLAEAAPEPSAAPPSLSGVSVTEGAVPPIEPANGDDSRGAQGERTEAAAAIDPVSLPASVAADLAGRPGTDIPIGQVSGSESVRNADDTAATRPTPTTPARSSPATTEPDSSRTTSDTGSRSPTAAENQRAGDRPPRQASSSQPAPRPVVRTIHRDSITPLRADLEVALRTGDLALLRSTLGRLTPSELERLSQDEMGRSALEFARLVTGSVDEIEAALAAGRGAEALAGADRLARQFPAIERSLGLRDRAARRIEAESERQIAAGQLAGAEALLRQLEQSWPERPDLGRRLQVVAGLQREARSEVAMAEILAFERDRLPHAALQRLGEVEATLDRAQVTELRDRFETKLTQMDRTAPRIEIDANSDIEPELDQPLVIRLRAEDDYLVSQLTAHVRDTRGQSRQISAERLGSRVFRLVIPAEVHGNQRVHLWAEAVDYRGHVGRLGSAEDPVKVKWRRSR